MALAIATTAFAQDVRDYKWRADINNHGWKIGTAGGPMATMRAQRFATNPTRWVTININHVAQLDNLDQGDALGADRADFYAMIWVDGQVYKSKNFSHDEGNPNWKLRVPVNDATSTIRIRLYDDDSGLEDRDDHVDINPAKGEKDLILTFDAATGQISGDATGTAGTFMTVKGGGDDDNGKISFSIQ
ncbi:MAG TPA: C2 domain-containing protein [Fimbriimonas sp.]